MSDGASTGIDRKLTDHVSLGVLTRVVPRYIVDEVLTETGSREKRSRSLPAHLVVYFVLALALFHDGYEEVLRKLVNGLRFARVWSVDWTVPTTGAITQARQRLGSAPMKALFARVASPVATAGTPGAWLDRRRLMAMDGVMIDMPDTEENCDRYPKAIGGTRRPFPQMRAVGLSECSTHAIVAAAVGSIRIGERELAGQLLDSVSEDMLIIADRGFFSYQIWSDFLETGADLLFRAWSTMPRSSGTSVAGIETVRRCRSSVSPRAEHRRSRRTSWRPGCVACEQSRCARRLVRSFDGPGGLRSDMSRTPPTRDASPCKGKGRGSGCRGGRRGGGRGPRRRGVRAGFRLLRTTPGTGRGAGVRGRRVR